MGKIIISVLLSFILLNGAVKIPMQAFRSAETAELDEEAPDHESLYSACAVLMDGDSGRVLYEKNGYEARPMASTTKIMTCILALESLNLDTQIRVSDYAASQPQVRLGMQEGEVYRLEDLLYSLMLESHNDSAVAIAEAVSGSTDAFVREMNLKAEEIGCKDTYFVTPNGLDAAGKDGRRHSASAADMAGILRYCVMESPQKDLFRKITGTGSYSFFANGKNFSFSNHNAFLFMMEGAFSGKTGFTGEAGYCYVGAVERDGKTLIVALLACGWPGNKTYKWKDTRVLMEYGLSAYEKRYIYKKTELFPVPVDGGIPESGDLSDRAFVSVREELSDGGHWEILMRPDEQVTTETVLPDRLCAPVEKDRIIGRIYYELDGIEVAFCDIRTEKSVGKPDFQWCIYKIIKNFLINF